MSEIAVLSPDQHFLAPEFEQPETAEVYECVEMLTSDVVFDQYQNQFEQEAAAIPQMQEYDGLRQAERAATRSLQAEYHAGNQGTDNLYRQEVTRLQAEEEAFPEEVRAAHRKLEWKRKQFSNYNTMLVGSHSVEAQRLLHLIQASPGVAPIDRTHAPLKDFAQNTEQAWQHVPADQVHDYLKSKRFTEPYDIRQEGQRKIQIEAADDPVDIPLDMLVNAEGFDSWEGRDGQRGAEKRVQSQYSSFYNAKSKSLDVIKHYASLPTEIPPVSTISLFVQPNGVIFGDNDMGDSHRIAAALLRGDETIKANSVVIRAVDRDIFELPVQPAA